MFQLMIFDKSSFSKDLGNIEGICHIKLMVAFPYMMMTMTLTMMMMYIIL